MYRKLKSPGSRLIATTAITLGFVLIRYFVAPILGTEARLIIFPIPIMLCAWLAGFRFGIYSTFLSGFFGYVFFLQDKVGFGPLALNQAVHLILFIFEGILASFFADRLRTHQKQAETNETRANAEHKAWLDSEKRVRRLIDSHVFGVLFYNPDGTISNANDLFLQMIGYTREEMNRGLIRWAEMTPPEWKEINDKAWEDLLTIGYCVPFEKEYFRKDGSRVPVIVGAANIGTNTMDGIAYVLDISDRKEMEALVKESQDRLSQALSASGMGTWDYNPVTNALVWDARTREIHGVPPDAAITFDLYLSRIHPDDRATVVTAIQNAMTPGKSENFYVEFRTVPADNVPERWISGNGRVIFDGSGNPQRFIGLSEDITEKKKAENVRAESERFLRRVIDSVTAFVGVCTPDGTIIEANEPALKIADIEREAVLGKKLWEAAWWESLPNEQERLKAAVKKAMGGIAVRFDLKARSASGRFMDLDFALMPMFDDQGQVTHLIPSSVDITHRAEQAEQLRRSEDQFRQLAEAIPPMVWITDSDGNQIYFNERWFEFTGQTESESNGWGWTTRLHPDDRAKVREAWEESIATHSPYEIEFRLRNSEGEYRWLLARARPVMNPDGSVSKWFGSCTDIEDQKRAEETLRRTGEQLEALVQARTLELTNTNRELEAFSYSVSHDLRTPLRSIEGFSQALLEDELPRLSERGQKDLLRIRAASQRMGRIIDDLLSLSRLSRAEMRHQEIDLEDIARRTLTALTSQDPERDVEVKISQLPIATGDGGLVYILMENLLGNAWKFTAKATRAQIEIGSYIKEGETVYYVKDNGAGFDMAYYDKLFGAFQRLHRLTEFSGTGVGLATARRVVHRHGGRIWAEGFVGQGATFYFTLGVPNPQIRGVANFGEKAL